MRYSFENYELNTIRHEFRAFGVLRVLEPQVFDLLLHFVRSRGRLVSRDELIAVIWKGRIVSDSTIDARLHATRKAVDDSGRSQRLIKTVPRRGYRFVADVEAVEDVGLVASSSGTFHDPLATHKPALVVLPIANLSGDRQQQYFADGITDDIITALSRFRSLFVSARGSSFTYTDKVIEPVQVGRELGVRYLLQGSVRRSDRRVRISLHLIDTERDTCIWAEQFDRDERSLLELQDDIVRSVVGIIEAEISSAERHRARWLPKNSFDAWDQSQLGFWHFWRMSRADFRIGLEHFEGAIENDPGFGFAHVGLAMQLLSAVNSGWVDDNASTLERARRAAETAISLDHNDGLAHTVLGRISTMGLQLKAAIADLALALELNPNLVYAYFGMGLALFWDGRGREAIGHFEEAMRRSPRDPLFWAFELHVGFCHYSLQEHEQAKVWFEKAQNHMKTNSWPSLGLAMVEAKLGHKAAAVIAVKQARQLQPNLCLSHVAPMLRRPKGLNSVELLRRSGLPD